ncbi:MAG: hypothetical protein QM754_17085 [Tepidisphaeraceae bacterium]
MFENPTLDRGRFGRRRCWAGDLVRAIDIAETLPAKIVDEPKPPRVKSPKPKNDPRLIAAARELRDRWLEQVNGNGAERSELIALPALPVPIAA